VFSNQMEPSLKSLLAETAGASLRCVESHPTALSFRGVLHGPSAHQYA
jgi:hypothetical protein